MTVAVPVGTLSDVLTRLELRELTLLRWGVTGAGFTHDEILEIVADYLREHRLPQEPNAVLQGLVDRVAVIRTPQGLYRSRMAETVRLIATNRQVFSNRDWRQAAPLVVDYRIEQRPRRRPKRDLPGSSLSGSTRGQGRSVAASTFDRLAPARVSGFQERAASEVVDCLSAPGSAGVMISAGTGSGKTNAFFIPAVAWLAEQLAADQANRNRILALYPRGELLKDQLRAVLGLTLRAEGATRRPIRLGAWFGPTPAQPRFVRESWRKINLNDGALAWACPFLACPSCDDPGELMWTDADIRADIERLVCRAPGCGFQIAGDRIALTRASISERPPDIMFTTTESLNRQLADPDSHRAFGLDPQTPTRAVLLDEVHTYEGLSGAQNALLMRRLTSAVPGALAWFGLSATLVNPGQFLSQFTGLPVGNVVEVTPAEAELEESGAEYLLALRHDPSGETGVLSASIQTAMVLTRCLDVRASADPFNPAPDSQGMFGSKAFLFTDKLDVTNRLYWDLLDAEGWWDWGRPKERSPLTLAHSRSESQGKLSAQLRSPGAARDPWGQWWWLPEHLGRSLDGDDQLRVSRTSSQDVGVAKDADVVVATASLEVGYDDDAVGAVIQHRAPHDAARFLQRKGRAGRDPEMRPWTTVVLSNWGRDLAAWQLYDQMFSPVLDPVSLPLKNRYVWRMQAVYALLDWLALRLEGETKFQRSAWADLAGPADLVERGDAKYRLKRQERATRLLEGVLKGGPERESLVQHLRRAFAIGDQVDEAALDAILWDPPRSLLMAVVPTALRQLKRQWAGEVPASDDRNVRFRNPMPQFITGNLFDDLLAPEVEVIVPPAGQFGETEVSGFPAVRSIRELMPGSVTRHFGVQSFGRRHWLQPPVTPDGHVDVKAEYAAEFTTTLDVGGSTLPLYRPVQVRLAVPPPEVRDSSSVNPVWEVDLEALGQGRSATLGPTGWDAVLAEVSFHTHRVGGGVRVRRYARSAEGAINLDSGAQPVAYRFLADGEPVALGVEIDVDAMRLRVSVPKNSPEPSPLERADRLRDLVARAASLARLHWAERQQIAEALSLVVVRNSPTSEAEFGSISDVGLIAQVNQALQDLGHTASVPEASGRAVAIDLRDAAGCAWRARDVDWSAWWQERFAASVASCWVNAACRARPELDSSDLSIDTDPRHLGVDDSEEIEVWISELSPGGNGHIELLQEELLLRPRRFRRFLQRALEPSDLENLHDEIAAFLRLAEDTTTLADACANLAAAWPLGHVEATDAFARVRAETTAAGLEPSRAAWTTISSRLLAIGSSPHLVGATREVIEEWDRLQVQCGLLIESRLLAAVIALTPGQASALHLSSDDSVVRRVNVLGGFFWPRAERAALADSGSANPFGLLSDIDPFLVRSLVHDGTATLPLDPHDAEPDDVRAALLADGQVAVQLTGPRKAELRALLLKLLATPLEVDSLLVYPRVEGVRRTRDSVVVTLGVDEVML